MMALVLGGYGAVGARVVSALRSGGDDALAAGRNPARADRVVDLDDLASLHTATADVDVVVNASGVEDPDVVAALAGIGVPVVDVTATSGYIAALERLDPPRPVLVSAGLAPGLTNLLAAAVHEEAGTEPIDIAVVLGAGERHGDASTDWAYSLLGQCFRDPASGDEIRNYTRPRRFELPGYGARRLVRAGYSDQHALTRDFGVPVRTTSGRTRGWRPGRGNGRRRVESLALC